MQDLIQPKYSTVFEFHEIYEVQEVKRNYIPMAFMFQTVKGKGSTRALLAPQAGSELKRSDSGAGLRGS